MAARIVDGDYGVWVRRHHEITRLVKKLNAEKADLTARIEDVIDDNSPGVKFYVENGGYALRVMVRQPSAKSLNKKLLTVLAKERFGEAGVMLIEDATPAGFNKPPLIIDIVHSDQVYME